MLLPDKDLIREAAELLGIDGAFIEKDWFVTQLIQSTITHSSDPSISLIFSGGTALSKAHKKIDRFSEDVDFRIHSTPTAKRSQLSRWRKSLVLHLRNEGWEILEENIHVRDLGRYIAIKIPFPRHFTPHAALRPELKLEFRARPIQLPPVTQSVGAIITELKKAPPEIENIACLNITENAADKLAALIWRIPARAANVKRAEDPNLVRHIHDLAILIPEIQDFSSFKRCLLHSMKEDAAEIHLAIEPDDIPHKIQAFLDLLGSTASYQREYTKFASGVSFADVKKRPSFEEGVAAIESLMRFWR